MPIADLVTGFDELFAGRRDAYGAVHGEAVKAPLDRPTWEGHLYFGGSVGVYPLVLDERTNHWYVKWGCSDIDYGFDLLVLAQNLHKALSVLGLTSWIEKTKGKGFHVWVFAYDWVPATDMRNALLVAHNLAGVPATEVNPKQTSLADGQLGNYVNVPYSSSYVDEGKRVVIMPEDKLGRHLSAENFVRDAAGTRNDPLTIKAAAKLYVPPPEKQVAAPIPRYEGNNFDLVDKLSPFARKVFREGPLPGGDRSSTLSKLAHLCKESGLHTSEAFVIVRDADLMWGKFASRPDGDKYLNQLVVNAYG